MSSILLTVSQLNFYVKKVFEKDKVLKNVAIKGEISNFKKHSSGHIYMSLKDENSIVKAIIFRNAASRFTFSLENGMKIVANGEVTVYEPFGEYHVNVQSVKLDGIGELHIAFEKMKQKLSSEGLFDSKHKKHLPKFPKTIGIVTSKTGAAIKDMLSILERRFKYSKIILYPVLVQGASAYFEIIEALEYFNFHMNVDVIIIGRGGGSIEDLWAFNEEALARAIFESNIPIVSAVGHEIDFTISDFVADLRAPTPSAAAELIVPNQDEIFEYIKNLEKRMLQIVNSAFGLKKTEVKYIKSRIMDKMIMSKFNNNRMRIDVLCRFLENYLKNVLTSARKKIEFFEETLKALNPSAVLSRGYSFVKNNKGELLKSVEDFKENDLVDIVISDGKIVSKVEKIVKSSE